MPDGARAAGTGGSVIVRERKVTIERHGGPGFESTRGVIHWERTPGIGLCDARLRGDYENAAGQLVECVVCIELAGGRA